MSDTTSAPSDSPAPFVEDAGVRAQRAAEAHLQAIWEAEEAFDEDPNRTDVDYPASAPWDGCETCVIREILHAAWPILEQDTVDTMVKALRDAGHSEAADLILARHAEQAG